MYRYLAILCLFAGSAFGQSPPQPAPVQPPTFSLTLTLAELDAIVRNLRRGVYDDVAPVLFSIERQIQEQARRAESPR
jgi:hypothetical protein